MKHLVAFLVSLTISFMAVASESYSSYAYHSFTVKDRDFNVQHESQGDGKPMGLIIDADIDGTEYIGITLGEETIYEVQVVNVVKDEDSQQGIKCVMYQGGMKFQGEIVVINVLFTYDLDKNSNIPETVLVDVVNSPTIMELSGLVKLNSSTR